MGWGRDWNRGVWGMGLNRGVGERNGGGGGGGGEKGEGNFCCSF